MKTANVLGWILAAGLAVFCVAPAAQADVVDATFTDHGRIQDTNNDGTPDVIVETQPYAGDNQAGSFSRYVMLFALPTLDAGEYVSAASFSAILHSRTLNDSDVDLDVAFLEKGSSAAVGTGDYLLSPTALMSSIATPSSTTGDPITWSNATLTTAINDAYEGGDSYVAFRLQYPESGAFWDATGSHPKSDGDGKHDFYAVRTDDTDYGGPDPTLQLTVIPEPASIGLMALSAAGLFALRRRAGR